MHFKHHIFIGILFLSAIPFSDAESSTAEVISTTALDGSTTPGAATTAVTSVPDSTGTTGTGTTVVPPSTTAGTQGTGSTTIGQSTAVPASTTPGPSTTPGTTQLPNVTVNYVQFGLLQCDDTVCTYQFDTPKNDQAFLATEDSIVGTDQSQYSDLKAAADKIDKNINDASNDANNKIQNLQSMLDAIQKNLDAIKENIDSIQKAQTGALSNLLVVEQFISTVSQAQSSCLYMRCLAPTTPTRPTTTPTPVPTTPQSPCVNFTCPTTDGSNGTEFCDLKSNNQAYCTNCLGDLDGFTHCETVTCSPTGTNFAVDKTGGSSIWYSYGYNSSSDNSVVTPNSNCIYNFNVTGFASGFQLADSSSFNLSCLSSSVTLSVVSDGLTTILDSSLTARRINPIFKTAVTGKFVFTSAPTSTPTQGYCYLNLVPIPLPTPGTPSLEEEQEEIHEVFEKPKPVNRFFGWLMGY